MLQGLHSFGSIEFVIYEVLLFVSGICQLTLEKCLRLFELNCMLVSGFGLFIEFDHYLKVIKNIGVK